MNPLVAPLVCAAILFSAALAVTASAQPTPGHGARSKATDGTTVIFDKVRGVHVVPDQQNTFYDSDRFYRHVEGLWLTASAAKGPWELTTAANVPQVLRDAYFPPRKRVTATLPSGVVAVFDPELKVYSVPAQEGVYIHDGLFYRYVDGVWMSGRMIEGPWDLAVTRTLPAPIKNRVKPPAAGQKVTLPSGTQLEYDADLLLFRVAGQSDLYLNDGMFIARRDGKWVSSTTADSGFAEMNAARVPAPLKGYYKKKEGPRSASKGKEPPKKPTTKEEREALRAERDKVRAERDAIRAEREAQKKNGRPHSAAAAEKKARAAERIANSPKALERAERAAAAAKAKEMRAAKAAEAKEAKADGKPPANDAAMKEGGAGKPDAATPAAADDKAASAKAAPPAGDAAEEEAE